MINYNILNEFVEKLKSAGITPNELKAVAKAFADGDIQGKLTAGTGITITNDNVISAGSGGNSYLHNIVATYAPRSGEAYEPAAFITFNTFIKNNSNIPLTKLEVLSYLKTNEIDVLPFGFTWYNGAYEHVRMLKSKITQRNDIEYALFISYELAGGNIDNRYANLNSNEWSFDVVDYVIKL